MFSICFILDPGKKIFLVSSLSAMHGFEAETIILFKSSAKARRCSSTQCCSRIDSYSCPGLFLFQAKFDNAIMRSVVRLAMITSVEGYRYVKARISLLLGFML